MEIRQLTETERKYVYTQSNQLIGQTGCIGYLRGDFGRSGNGFFTSWNDHRKEYKTDEFRTELDDVINALRSEEYGLLQNCSGMWKYAGQYPDSSYEGSYCTEYGFRVDTGNHSFLIRCNPTLGDYNFYCYCYVSKWLDQHIQNAEKGIRFIDVNYNELFRIADGKKIVITDTLGGKEERICRYIDEYHTEIGNQLYHICQFAELMNSIDATYEAKDKEQSTAYYERSIDVVSKEQKKEKSR